MSNPSARLPFYRSSEELVVFLISTLAMPFMALGEVWTSAARGLGAVARSQIPASIVQHLLLGSTLIFSWR